ncbi:MAG: TRAM domain-containing protein [Phycisphaerae bacterium]|nr:TRAM domain-containing protein [Phycisphaerae bacterium]
MVLHFLRIFFMLVVLGLTIPLVLKQETGQRDFGYMAVRMLMPAGLAFVLILVDIFWKHKRLRGLSGLFFGVLAGVVLAYAINRVLDLGLSLYPTLVDPDTAQIVISLVDAALIFLCVTIVMQTKDDFRFIIPYVEFARHAKGARPLLLDTSVIIDGRVADVAETGVLTGEVVVPRFILNELQSIADSSDKLKRNRGRRGLDVLAKMRASAKIDVRILDAPAAAEEAADTDAKLVALAKHLDGWIVTNDYNLNKVAQLRGVDVININDLANSLKPVVLPGETLTVRIVKPGEEPGQGVGYLDDGTMVVAEQGRDRIGKEVTLSVTSVLQTSAGKMIFGRIDADKTFARRPDQT